MKALIFLSLFVSASASAVLEPTFICDGGNPVKISVKVSKDSARRYFFDIKTTSGRFFPKITDYTFPVEEVIKNRDGSKMYVNYKNQITLELQQEEMVPGALYYHFSDFKGVGERKQRLSCRKPGQNEYTN